MGATRKLHGEKAQYQRKNELSPHKLLQPTSLLSELELLSKRETLDFRGQQLNDCYQHQREKSKPEYPVLNVMEAIVLFY